MKKNQKGRRRVVHEAEGSASGALAGALVGAAAGPPGAVAGAIVGGVAGALAGAAMDTDAAIQAERTRELDETIGVMDGEMGAPNLEHPPAKIGRYSLASTGVDPSAGDEAPAEGPIQPPDE